MPSVFRNYFLHSRRLAVGLTFIAIVAASPVGADETSEPSPALLEVPDGYTVELAAAPPLVGHPLMADFDEQGRLYIAANAGENLPRAELEARLPNFVQRLEDTNGDGVFDRATTFADKMTFPQGCLWHAGSLYVASSGAIWKLTDTNDDGVADEREKLVGDFGYTGNAADVHGPFLGPDGRIYWCEGRHGHEIKDRDGKLISKGKAARIFSCREDGSDVQTFCTGGMDNPVEIVFTPEGDMLGTVNLMYAQPRGDCLVHWQYGGVYPREDFAESLGAELVRTGDLLPEVHNFGHVAVSGLCRASGNRLGPGFEGSLIITQFNTNRIVRMKLKPSGSTFAVDRVEDFAVSTSKDFHPTDVLEDADGSLLVIDTGGWFRIGCPQSQVEKSHIKGAIYRIRRTDAVAIDDPRGLALDWHTATAVELIGRLADDHPAVRERATTELAKRLRGLSAEATLKAVGIAYDEQPHKNWHTLDRILSRAGTKAALRLQCRHLVPRSGQVGAGFALRTLLYADLNLLPPSEKEELIRTLDYCLLHAAFNGPAANVLGRHYADQDEVVAELVAALEVEGHDRFSKHAITLALIATGDRAKLTELLLSQHERVREAAAIALEQLRRPRLELDEQDWLEIPAASLGKPLSDDDRQHLLAVEASLPAGDAARGRMVFESAKATCNKCHRIAGVGGQVGPDLSTIGRSRARRDLLEAILYPSASFVRGFAPYLVVTEDGQTHSGIVLGENSQELHLGIDKEKSARIANRSIEEIRAVDVSIMPQDVHRVLTPQELADLIAYLESLKSDS